MRKALKSTAALVAALSLPAAAHAHHPMGGVTPMTFMDGFLSGIGHPMLGPDHLAFIVGIGLLVAMSRRWTWLPVAFVATLIPGVMIHARGLDLGPNEVLVALSVVLVGAALLLEDRISSILLAGAVMAAGLFHGYAFGETIVGAETTPLLAYLAGLSVMILSLTMGIALVGRRLIAGPAAPQRLQRVAAGLLIAGGGLFMVQSLIG
jgi:urease accessory protein